MWKDILKDIWKNSNLFEKLLIFIGMPILFVCVIMILIWIAKVAFVISNRIGI